MKLLTQERKAKISPLYSQEEEKDTKVSFKIFDPTGSWNWYAIEVDEKEYDYDVDLDSELRYFTLNQLETAKQVMIGLKA